MLVHGFDVATARGLYPTVGAGTVYLEGGLSALQPESVLRAVIASLRSSPAQPGSTSRRSRLGERVIERARAAIADLVGSAVDSVILGTNTADLTGRFADVLGRDWQLGDEIVLTRLENDRQLDGWLAQAHRRGVIVRWAEVDIETGTLPTWQFEELINERTRLVSVPIGNPTTGTVPDVHDIAKLTRTHGALLALVAGMAITHLPIDLDAIGADLITLDAATFGGPQVAAIATRDGLLREITGATAEAATDCLEPGALPLELLDGVTAAVEHLAQLAHFSGERDGHGTHSAGIYRTGAYRHARAATQREKVISSISAVGEYTTGLYLKLDAGLRAIDAVTVLGSSTDRLPVAAFTVDGLRPSQVGRWLAEQGIEVWVGPTHHRELMTAFGVDELGGAIHIGVMPHTNRAEIARFLDAIAEVASD